MEFRKQMQQYFGAYGCRFLYLLLLSPLSSASLPRHNWKGDWAEENFKSKKTSTAPAVLLRPHLLYRQW